MRRCHFLVVLGSASLLAQRPAEQLFTVGFEPSEKLVIWYPATGDPAPYQYSDGLWGSVVMHGAPVQGRRFPLVIFSHGFHGCKTQSAFLTEELARHGFIVAAPHHADAACEDGDQPSPPPVRFMDPEEWDDQVFSDRGHDVRSALDSLLADPSFGPLIDPEKIAGAGHSLGGYTMFALAGGWESWYEPRFKAVLLLSPYVTPFLVQGRIPAVAIPKMYQGGTLDLGVTPWIKKQNGAYHQSLPEKFFLELRRAGHLEWSNVACGDAGTVARCLAQQTNAGLIVSFALDFLDRELNGRTSRDLLVGSPRLADYRFALAPNRH